MNFLHVFGTVVVEEEAGVPSWDPSVLLRLTQGDSLGRTDLCVKNTQIIIIHYSNCFVQHRPLISYFQYMNAYLLFLSTLHCRL
jgi:hypothetical protein